MNFFSKKNCEMEFVYTSDFIIDDEEKEWAWSLRDELEWVDDVTAFKCGSCGQVLLRHFTGSCGHKLCPDCFSGSGNEGLGWACQLPSCLQLNSRAHFESDFEFEQKLYEKHVRCPNRMYGCLIIEPLKDLGEHFKMCKNNKDNGIVVALRKMTKLDQKVNSISADVSQVKEMQSELTEEVKAVKTEVAKLIENIEQMRVSGGMRDGAIWSTFQSLQQLKEQMRTNHVSKLAETQYELLKLKIQNELLREENERLKQSEIGYEKSKKNLMENWLNYKCYQLETQTLRMQHPTFDQSIEVENGKIPEAFYWDIENIKNKLLQKHQTYELKSQWFNLEEFPLAVQLKMEFNEDEEHYFNLRLLFKCSTTDKVIKEATILPDIYVRFERPQTGYHYQRCHKFDWMLKGKFSHQRDENCKRLDKNLLRHRPLAIGVFVEPRWMSERVFSRDGTLFWALQDYEEKKRMSLGDHNSSYDSPYFYTKRGGYRVKASLCFNYGFGENHFGAGLVARVSFLRGEFDEKLRRTFGYRLIVSLVDRADAKRSLVRSEEFDIKNGLTGSVFLGRWEEVEKMVESDDTLYYSVVIESLS